MPIFCFHLPGPEPVQRFEFASIDQARRTALQIACAKLSQTADSFWQTGEWQMNVTDEHGLAQFGLTFFGTEAPAARRVETQLVPPAAG